MRGDTQEHLKPWALRSATRSMRSQPKVAHGEHPSCQAISGALEIRRRAAKKRGAPSDEGARCRSGDSAVRVEVWLLEAVGEPGAEQVAQVGFKFEFGGVVLSRPRGGNEGDVALGQL